LHRAVSTSGVVALFNRFTIDDTDAAGPRRLNVTPRHNRNADAAFAAALQRIPPP
jgi:hypothetical protein